MASFDIKDAPSLPPLEPPPGDNFAFFARPRSNRNFQVTDQDWGSAGGYASLSADYSNMSHEVAQARNPRGFDQHQAYPQQQNPQQAQITQQVPQYFQPQQSMHPNQFSNVTPIAPPPNQQHFTPSGFGVEHRITYEPEPDAYQEFYDAASSNSANVYSAPRVQTQVPRTEPSTQIRKYGTPQTENKSYHRVNAMPRDPTLNTVKSYRPPPSDPTGQAYQYQNPYVSHQGNSDFAIEPSYQAHMSDIDPAFVPPGANLNTDKYIKNGYGSFKGTGMKAGSFDTQQQMNQLRQANTVGRDQYY